jgi:hypothetical protein
VNDYFLKAVRGTSLHQLVTATTLYGYIEQGPSTISMSNPRDNGAPVDSVNRPAFGYILNLLCLFLLFKFYLRFNLNTCTCSALTGSLIIVMNLLIISGIKMYRKLPNCLTFWWATQRSLDTLQFNLYLGVISNNTWVGTFFVSVACWSYLQQYMICSTNIMVSLRLQANLKSFSFFKLSLCYVFFMEFTMFSLFPHSV